MEFEWDEAKRQNNLKKHGMDFEDAQLLFNDEALVVPDLRRDYGEPRFILINLLANRLAVVVFTFRGQKTRIISMRKANERERNRYYQERPRPS